MSFQGHKELLAQKMEQSLETSGGELNTATYLIQNSPPPKESTPFGLYIIYPIPPVSGFAMAVAPPMSPVSRVCVENGQEANAGPVHKQRIMKVSSEPKTEDVGGASRAWPSLAEHTPTKTVLGTRVASSLKSWSIPETLGFD